MTDLIHTSCPGSILRLTLNRAPVNALSAAFLMDFADAVDRFVADDGQRALVIDSGLGVFSAGLDLKAAQHFDAEGQRAIVAGLNRAFLALYACPKPVVVAVNGAAIAGGLFFVLAADARLGTARARLGLAEIRVGVDFPVAPMEIARAALAPDDLRLLMLGGHPIGAEDALRRGILDSIVAPEALGDAALEAAAHPPGAFARVKAQIRGDTCDAIRARIATGPQGDWFTGETVAAMRAMIG
ncbi:MAG: enoyl-CoA hydratase/isomerase family protein [Proteobacteria bacterium]|nr:enoyl-CoA hydratase/isomerase family protein [Pseudomonadota bacterium]